MVSFFGLKIGGEKKKKADSSAHGGASAGGAPKWKKVDQNTMGEGQFFGARTYGNGGVYDGSVLEAPSRPGTSHSMRSTKNSPYMLQTHSLAASSMYDLANVAPPLSRGNLRPSASDANLGMRWGNASSASLHGPPALGSRPGTPSRPGTSGGERKKAWVNPLDVHFNKSGSAGSFIPPAPKSPLGQFELQVDVGNGSDSLMGDITRGIESQNALTRQMSAPSPGGAPPEPAPHAITHVNSTSPPLLSPLAANQPHSPPQSYSSSPPLSISGGSSERHMDSRSALRPNREMPKGIGPTGLPSPALSQREGGMDHLSPNPWDGGGKPVIQNVAAKRDTLTMSGPRRQSLSMKIEEFEKSLVTAQHESEQRRNNRSPQMQAGQFDERERKPSPVFVNPHRGPRTESPLGRGPPMQREVEDRNGPRAAAPFANREPRPQSPMGRAPPILRPESPILKPMVSTESDSAAPLDPPPRNPLRVATPDLYARSTPSPTEWLPMQRQPSPPPSELANPVHTYNNSNHSNASAASSSANSDSTLSNHTVSTRAAGFDDRKNRPMVGNGPSPMLRSLPTGPGAPRRPAPEEYGVPLPRSNSDRERGRGPPPGAVGAHRAKAPPTARPTPVAEEQGYFPFQSPEQPQPVQPVLPVQPIQPPHSSAPRSQQPPPQHQQQRPYPLRNGSSREGGFAEPIRQDFSFNNKQHALAAFDFPIAREDTSLSGPPTPDSTNWPLPSPGLAPPNTALSAPPRMASRNAPHHPLPHLPQQQQQPQVQQRQPSQRSPRGKIPPPLNLANATAKNELMFSGPFTPPPQRSMTTPVAACDEPSRPKTAGGGSGTIGMARGLSLRQEREREWESKQQQQQQTLPRVGVGEAGGGQPQTPRRPDFGLKAPTGIADSFGTGFI